MDWCIWYITITKGIEQWRICLEIVSILGFWASNMLLFFMFVSHTFLACRLGELGGCYDAYGIHVFYYQLLMDPTGTSWKHITKQYPPNYKLNKSIPNIGINPTFPAFAAGKIRRCRWLCWEEMMEATKGFGNDWLLQACEQKKFRILASFFSIEDKRRLAASYIDWIQLITCSRSQGM